MPLIIPTGFYQARGVFGPAAGGGGGSASFTFGASVGNTGAQGSSPYAAGTGTFNASASNLCIVALVQANDFGSGTITGVSVAGNALTLLTGVNNANEQAILAYGSIGAVTTGAISVTFTGTIMANISTGKVVTSTPTPYSTGVSTSGQGGGVAVPFSVNPTTGSGGIPASGVGVGVVGDFFASSRTFTSVTPTQADIINNATPNGQNLAFGSSTTAGASNGITVNASASLFPAWAIASWSP